MSEDQQKTRHRLTLTRRQHQAGIGADLLALCQTMTADGSISEEEVAALRSWLVENEHADLPAIEFLLATVEQIVADGKITQDERDGLYRAIERILPTEAKRQAAERRRTFTTLLRERSRAGWLASKEERVRNRPMKRANFMVAGIAFEGRAALVARFVRPGNQVYLIRDRHNPYDTNAIEIRLRNGAHIGYVPREYSEALAPFLDQGCRHQASVTKVIGYRRPVPVIQAVLHQPTSTLTETVAEEDVPLKQTFDVPRLGPPFEDTPAPRPPLRRTSPGCLLLFLILLLGLVGRVAC